MPKKLALMFAAGLAIAATSFDARAMPSSPAGLTRQQSDVTHRPARLRRTLPLEPSMEALRQELSLHANPHAVYDARAYL